MTNIIQTAERMIRDNTTAIGAICAEWNSINFEANTGLSFSTPKTRKALVAKLEAAIVELNSRDPRMVDGIDDREFSGNSIAAAHDEALELNNIDPRINAHNDLCDLAQAPQHLYATVNIDSRRFEQLQAQLTDFINKETPRYFVADLVYKVSKSGFVYRWDNEWVDTDLSIINLINMGAAEVTEADINANRINGVQS